MKKGTDLPAHQKGMKFFAVGQNGQNLHTAHQIK